MSCVRKINSGIEVNCSPLPGGVNDRLILLNKDDVVGYTLDPNMPPVSYTHLTLPTIYSV